MNNQFTRKDAVAEIQHTLLYHSSSFSDKFKDTLQFVVDEFRPHETVVCKQGHIYVDLPIQVGSTLFVLRDGIKACSVSSITISIINDTACIKCDVWADGFTGYAYYNVDAFCTLEEAKASLDRYIKDGKTIDINGYVRSTN